MQCIVISHDSHAVHRMSMSHTDIILSSTSLRKGTAHLSMQKYLYILVVILLAQPNHSLSQRGSKTSILIRLHKTLAFLTLVGIG
jgi:hypothetical protein